MKKITFAASGDSFITRRIPAKDDQFRNISSVIKSADVRFTNLEVTVHNQEGIPGAVSGGTWAMGPPAVLMDIKDYGFNLIAWANNHTLDYTFKGLEATEKYLNEHEFVHAGAGMNLASACEPRYLETEGGRVALVAATSSFHETWVAGEQRPDMAGRPGINPLRFQTTYKVASKNLQTLKEIASKVNINASRNLSIKEGFQPKRNDDLFEFGQYLFKESEEEGQSTSPMDKDMSRILKAINEAKRQAKYVLVSIHAHEMKGEYKDRPAEFIEQFSRKCIEEGADAVIGHGPHILRGIEIYQNKPIFYSLGNFIFQNETVSHLPADFYEKYQLDHSNNVADALDNRTRNNTIGFGVNHKIWESVIPVWKMEGKQVTEILLYPIELGYGQERYERGWPVLSENINILTQLAKLSEPYGTIIDIEGNVGKIRLETEFAEAGRFINDMNINL
ncbi:CapA family protein [Neobacillus sp. SAB-20_R2A]|uniref:CapA family protein n=1 Tax=Neobacillus sp. SAB-20_R2A TaxID=3120519 RepID=UPI003C6E80D1